jgi:hypothetical protein
MGDNSMDLPTLRRWNMVKKDLSAVIISLESALLLSGCAAMQQQQAQRMQQFNESIPVCNDEQDCKDKWSTAQIWVSRNCGMKIQIVTDTLIETYNSVGSSTDLAARVVKEPIGAGKYRIVITTGCANIFGCAPDAWAAALNFNRYVGSINGKY